MADKGKLVVISGPSGVGKSTICAELVKRIEGASLSISTTTRPKGQGDESPPGLELHGRALVLERPCVLVAARDHRLPFRVGEAPLLVLEAMLDYLTRSSNRRSVVKNHPSQASAQGYSHTNKPLMVNAA